MARRLESLAVERKNGRVSFCKHCGALIVQAAGAGRPKAFCSDACRKAYSTKYNGVRISEDPASTMISFDILYASKGGVKALISLVADGFPYATIAKHFGFSREYARQVVANLAAMVDRYMKFHSRRHSEE